VTAWELLINHAQNGDTDNVTIQHHNVEEVHALDHPLDLLLVQDGNARI